MDSGKGKKIGKYDVIESIGRGGMGVVYKAVDPAIGRQVAIKMMTGALADDPELLKRFYREAQSAGILQHPNIVIVHELGDLSGSPYLVMEYLEGESLDTLIRCRRELPLEDKLNIIIQVCNGLQYAHQRAVVHRDIKPANVMIANDGTAKIVDFGLARMGTDNVTRPGQVMGTINYMSPEQINARPVDLRTDIFATAVVLYELLTFALPFRGEDTGSTLLNIIHKPPPPLSQFLNAYPPELDAIIQRALAKDRDGRYQCAEDFSLDLIQVRELLKSEKIAAHLQTVEALMQRSQWEKARGELGQLLKIDRQHPRGNLLLRDVQQHIQKEENRAHARELRSQAEEALKKRNLDDALAHLDQAVKLEESNPELLRFRESVLEVKARKQKAAEASRRAESAQVAGELDLARSTAEEAIGLDPESSEAKALYASIQHAIAERARQEKLRALVGQARRQISARQFSDALQILRDAEALDASAPEVRELSAVASAGYEQEQRRKAIEALAAEIEELLNRDDYRAACAKAAEALQRFPDERRLQQLKTLCDKQRDASQRRIYIAEQISAAHKLLDQGRTGDALALLEEVSGRYPEDAAAHSMLALVQGTLERENLEQRKAEHIQRAKEMLRRKAYEDAIHLLQSGRSEFGTTECDDLIQFAQDEAAAHVRRLNVAAVAEQANRLIAAEQHQTAVELLERSLIDLPDDDLRMLLAGAQRHLAELRRAITEAVASAERLLQQQRVSEAVRFLESRPESFLRFDEFRAAMEHAREELQRISLFATAKGRLREALSREDFAAAAGVVEDCRRRYGDCTDTRLLDGELQTARVEAATRRVENSATDARTLLLGRSYAQALKMLDTVAGDVDMISEGLKLQWHSLRAKALSGIARQQRAREQQTPPTGPTVEFVSRHPATPTIAQPQWPLAGAAAPPAPPAEQNPHGLEVNVIGQGPDSSTTFRDESGPFSSNLDDVDRISQLPAELREATLLPAPPLTTGQEESDPVAEQRANEKASVVGESGGEPEAAAAVKSLAALPKVESVPAARAREYAVLEGHSLPVHGDVSTAGAPQAMQPPLGGPAATAPSLPEGVAGQDEALRVAEKHLAPFLGPVAKIAVRKAALRARDTEELYALLAEHLEREDDRTAFLAGRTGASRNQINSQWPADPNVASAAGIPTSRTELTREAIDRVAAMLAPYVGPISSVLTQRTARRTDSVRALCLLLGEHLETKADRARFLRDAGLSERE